MTLDRLVALSLLPARSRQDWPARLAAGDPTLLSNAMPGLALAGDALSDAHSRGVACVGWADPSYPEFLRTIPDPPPVLWYRGHPPAWAAPAVAIVGSRHAGAAARDVAFDLAAGLAGAGVTVVSGLAVGVDAAAHRGALSAGRTVAVLGCGVDVPYPHPHHVLRADIARAGALVSELPPGTPPLAHHFPARNRIISGLASAVVVVEAAEHSGSLITARLALEQGRDVFAVPGAVPGGRNRGAHALLRDGAPLVESAADILRELGWAPPPPPTPPDATPGDAPDIVAVLRADEAVPLDVIAAQVGQSAPVVLAALLDLELAGLVRRAGDGGFMRAR